MDTETSFDFRYFEETKSFQLIESKTICVSGKVTIPEKFDNFLKFNHILLENLHKFDEIDEKWLDSKGFYKELRIRGYDYGEEFQGIFNYLKTIGILKLIETY
jgi:hypothetical protein